MTAQEIDQVADLMVSTVKAALAPVLERLLAMEQKAAVVPKDGRDGVDGKDGAPGRDADESVVVSLKAELAALRGEISTKADATTWVPADLPTLVQVEVEKAVAMRPPPPKGEQGPSGEPGQSVTVDDVLPLIKGEVQRAVAEIPPAEKGAQGEPGASVDMAAVEALVTKAVSALPVPQDGRSVTLEDVEPMILSLVTKAVDAMPRAKDGKDGISVVDALVNRDGHLIQTFSDGATKDVGLVVGRDVDREEVLRFLTDAVKAIPLPKDGKDGVGFDDFQFSHDERGRLLLTLTKGDQTRTAVVPSVIDCGVWRQGETYVKGDGARYNGSWFIAQRDNPGKPEVGDGWCLAAKRGRDGRDGKDLGPREVKPVRIQP